MPSVVPDMHARRRHRALARVLFWTLPLLCSLCATGVFAAAPSVAPSALVATGAAPVASTAEVRLRDQGVFWIRAPRGAQSPQERAREASRALAEAAKQSARDVRTEDLAGEVLIYADDTLIVQLGEADARAAGDPSVVAHGALVATKLRQALEAERTRAQIADTVFQISLVVFLGLITLYVLRRSSDFERRLRARLLEHPRTVAPLRVQSFELLGRGSTRLMMSLGLTLTKWLLRGAVLYFYLGFVLSLFSPQLGFTEWLSGWVLQPFSQLLERLASAFPAVVVVGLAALVMGLLLRLNHLFFSSVAQGETQSEWFARDTAQALGRLVSIVAISLALVFAAPVVTGQSTGALANVGSHLLLALALAAAPMLASVGLGAVLVLRRHVRLGDRIEVSKLSGAVQHFGLLDLVLVGARGDELRVPYLTALFTPLRVLPPGGVRVMLSVDASASPTRTLAVLRESLLKVSEHATVRLVALCSSGTRYELYAPASDGGEAPLSHSTGDLAEQLLLCASEALSHEQIPLARTESLVVGAS